MKQIAIIGAGISGLTLLHYLKKRFGDSAQITLYEREAWAGGTIRSFSQDGCLFEWGPNGFLNNQPTTLQLIEDLGLTGQLIEAQKLSGRRYIQIDETLEALPANPFEFIETSLLSPKDKWSVFTGLFKSNISKDQSIYDYISQRFSAAIAENLVAPFISGVFAGDIKRLHMASAFPKFKRRGMVRPRMLSLQKGMGQLIDELSQRYKKHIQFNAEITALPADADCTIVATPAYAAAVIIEATNPFLAETLARVPYAPVAVAGLVFNQDSFKRKPEGFGYLVPSKANKEILGVLNESNVFAERAGQRQVMLRVMAGGMHHPSIINDSQEQILVKAIKEIDTIYGIFANPIDAFAKLWPKAIPQYEMNYPQLRQAIVEQCSQMPGLHLCANYLDGISFNDCIYNANTLAGAIKI